MFTAETKSRICVSRWREGGGAVLHAVREGIRDQSSLSIVLLDRVFKKKVKFPFHHESGGFEAVLFLGPK